MKDFNSPITTIPGIGIALDAAILAEIGDIHVFATPAKLLAFVGNPLPISPVNSPPPEHQRLNRGRDTSETLYIPP